LSPEREALSPPNLINPTAADFGGAQFGQAQPQTIPNSVDSHILMPDDATVRVGGTVTFNVNGGSHGIGIYPVSKKRLVKTSMKTSVRVVRASANNATLTANSDYKIVDGRHHLIIETDTAANQPRIDDPFHRYLSTSGSIPGQPLTAGAFLTGSTSTTVPGHRIEIRFTKAGRYLVVCQNRGHLINDHMFGFVNVVDNDDKDDDHGHNDHRDK